MSWGDSRRCCQAERGARPVGGLRWFEGLELEQPEQEGLLSLGQWCEHTCAVAGDAIDPAAGAAL